MKDLFNVAFIETLLAENEEFKKMFDGVVCRIGGYLHLCEMNINGKSAERVYMRAIAINDCRQKVINSLLFMNSQFSTPDEKIFAKYVRNIDSETVQDEIIEELYIQAWTHDWIEEHESEA